MTLGNWNGLALKIWGNDAIEEEIEFSSATNVKFLIPPHHWEHNLLKEIFKRQPNISILLFNFHYQTECVQFSL